VTDCRAPQNQARAPKARSRHRPQGRRGDRRGRTRPGPRRSSAPPGLAPGPPERRVEVRGYVVPAGRRGRGPRLEVGQVPNPVRRGPADATHDRSAPVVPNAPTLRMGVVRLSPGGAGPPGPGPAHGVVHDLPMRESLRFLSGSASSATRTPPQGWRRPAPARVGSVPETPECTVTPVPVFGAHGPGPGRPAPPRPRSSRWGCLSSFQLGHAGSSGELGARRGGAGGDGAVTATAAPGRAVRSAPASRTFGTPYRCSAGPRWCHDHHQVPSGRRRHLARARLSAVSTQLRFAG
jgi:hypothetical protein